jgi:hypothetical protein
MRDRRDGRSSEKDGLKTLDMGWAEFPCPPESLLYIAPLLAWQAMHEVNCHPDALAGERTEIPLERHQSDRTMDPSQNRRVKPLDACFHFCETRHRQVFAQPDDIVIEAGKLKKQNSLLVELHLFQLGR